MWRLTSSEPEIDSLIAVPSSRRSCLILSSNVSSLMQPSVVPESDRSRYRTRRTGRTLFVRIVFRLQPLGHRAPQFRPVSHVLPTSPLRVAPQHRGVADASPLVIRLAHEAAELRVDGDEVMPPVHRQEM